MDKILVIGANGLIGKKVVAQLCEAGHRVVAMVRKTEQIGDFSALGAETVVADLEADFSHAYAGCNRVIFTAGSGAATGCDKTLLIDLWAASKAIDLAKTNGIEHFLMVSSIDADNPDNGPRAIKPYLVAKHFADQHLTNSGVPYTILRPAQLTDEPGTGLVTTERPVMASEQVISRDDSAAAIVAVINTGVVDERVIELYQRAVPVVKAVL